MSSRSKAPLALAALASVVVAAGVAILTNAGSPDESEKRESLKQLGVLTTLATGGSQIGAVNFSTIKDKSEFHQALSIVLSLRAVASLNLNGMPVETSDLQDLQSLPSLVSLSLKECGLDDQGLEKVAAIRNLETLHVSDADITDAGLAKIVSLRQLATIDLSGTRVCCDLSPLAELPSLKWVLLARCPLESGALGSMKEAPALTRLTLTRSGYDPDDLNTLKSAVRGLRVDEFD